MHIRFRRLIDSIFSRRECRFAESRPKRRRIKRHEIVKTCYAKAHVNQACGSCTKALPAVPQSRVTLLRETHAPPFYPLSED
ncbi:hypothetical protein PUN4_50043 [Paraburkholderia unamae]|nr:hypothetical protein PUN4_50043 [Paraburkholderia unamae]